MISVHFQGKPFNITLIQVYAPTNNAEEAEIEQFYEDLYQCVLLAKLFSLLAFALLHFVLQDQICLLLQVSLDFLLLHSSPQ